jgi:hypothetical protein
MTLEQLLGLPRISLLKSITGRFLVRGQKNRTALFKTHSGLEEELTPINLGKNPRGILEIRLKLKSLRDDRKIRERKNKKGATIAQSQHGRRGT